MVEAAKRCKRIVQGGFQNRSDTGLLAAFAWLKEGHLGKLKRVRGFCYRNRESIGKQDTPLKPPATVDYNLWLGPAQDEILYRPKFHYDWHWFWNTGNGDIGNQGPHELDLCQWALGDPGLPASVQSFGGRFGWQDAGQTANMQFAAFEGGGRVPMVFEVCDMWLKPDLNAAPAFRGIRVGIILEYEGGEFRGGRGGGDAFDTKGGKIQKFPGDSGKDHLDCFIRAVRSRNESELRAPIEKAFKSSALAHMANISYRIGTNANKEQLEARAARIGDIGSDSENSSPTGRWILPRSLGTSARSSISTPRQSASGVGPSSATRPRPTSTCRAPIASPSWCDRPRRAESHGGAGQPPARARAHHFPMLTGRRGMRSIFARDRCPSPS
jgi:predicted dehydrogenase